MKKSILFLIQLPPPVHGASVMNEMISKSSHIKKSFDCTFFDISPEQDARKLGKFSFRKLIAVLFSYFKLLAIISGKKFDLCYFTLSPVGYALYKDFLYVFFLKIFGIKTIYHLHGKGIKNNSGLFNKVIYRYIFRETDVIHLSDSLFSDLDYYGNDILKKFTLANGIEAGSNSCNVKNEKLFLNVTYLSNLIPSKGAHVLLESLKFLPKSYAGLIKLNIAGGGRDSSYNSRIALLVEENKSYSINVLGPVYGQDKIDLLNSTDVFVLPTAYKNECFPLSILEAMKFGAAICSTNEGAISEIVNSKNGFIFDATRPESLASCLRYLIDDKELLLSMQENSKIIFQENYTFDVFEKKLVTILKNSMEQ